MRRLRARITAVVIAAAVAALAACASSGSSSTNTTTAIGGSLGSGKCSSYTTFPFGSSHTLSDSALIVGIDLGYFQKYCLKVGLVSELQASAQITALASSKIWAIGIGWIPAMYTAADQGIDLKVVADKAGLSATEGIYGAVVAKKYAGATSCQSLRNAEGQALGVASQLDDEQLLINNLLQPCGLKLSDYRLTVLPFAALAAAIDNGAVALAFQAEPTLTPLIQGGKAVYLTPNVGAKYGSSEISVGPVVFGSYLENPANKQVAQEFIDAYTLAARYYDDAILTGKNLPAVEQDISSYASIPLALFKNMHKPYYDPNDFTQPAVYGQVVNFAQQMENFFVAQNEMKSSQAKPASNIFDLSFARQAVKTLGVWKPPAGQS